MTEPGIGRIFVASLHQSIADLLPMRLEFYENWLNPQAMRHGTIGLAPVTAVLSFLRQEGPAYRAVSERAGRYAAEWTVAAQWAATRASVRVLPLALRARSALGIARRAIRRSSAGTRATGRLRRRHGSLSVSGSVFCTGRAMTAEPLCWFHGALVVHILELYGIAAAVEHTGCRALGGSDCLMEIRLSPRPADADHVEPAA